MQPKYVFPKAIELINSKIGLDTYSFCYKEINKINLAISTIIIAERH